jgi:ABC-type transporter Mla subunit MlaD
MLKKISMLALAVIVITGMSGPTLDFAIRFDQIDGLRKGDSVYFKTTRIGIVKDVEYTDAGNYHVRVAVENQYASLPKYSSTYYIDTDPKNFERKALRIIDLQNEGRVVKQNSVIKGMSKYAALYDQITQKFRKNLKVMESEITELFRDLQGLSEDEQIKQLESQLEKILKDVEKLSSQMRHKLETEILPRIKEQLNDLKSRLKKNGREEKLDNAEEKFEEVSEKMYI